MKASTALMCVRESARGVLVNMANNFRVTGKFLGLLSNCQFLKDYSLPWRSLAC
jgi:hypothetical protein